MGTCIQTQPCGLTHCLNPRLVHLVLTTWLTSTVGRNVDLLLYIPQICHTKKWCWVGGSKNVALLRHLTLGSQAPLLSCKGTPSSGSSSQDSRQPQKSTTAVYYSLQVRLARWWVLWSSQAVEGAQQCSPFGENKNRARDCVATGSLKSLLCILSTRMTGWPSNWAVVPGVVA